MDWLIRKLVHCLLWRLQWETAVLHSLRNRQTHDRHTVLRFVGHASCTETSFACETISYKINAFLKPAYKSGFPERVYHTAKQLPSHRLAV